MGTEDTILEVQDLASGYGAAQVLYDIDFTMGREAVAIVGRNGMGKTTLCNTIMGLVPAIGGSAKLQGSELVGSKPYKIAAQGIGYVPQGRRLFKSLSVDEHLQMLAKGTKGQRWTKEAVYDLFPRLTERRKVSGAALSGGEQQMLAIGRALLLNAPLIIMDEPSEGLAPAIVDQLIETCHTLVGEGHAVLLVEQNLAVATEVADRQLIMVSGRIETEMPAEDLMNDADAQRRYLGVDSLEDDAA
jgi:branched-chain amino acid transport system ATP-binding protein